MDDSIKKAQLDMRQAMQAGRSAECPCCYQNVAASKRKLDRSICLSLSYLVSLHRKTGGPIHYTSLARPFGRYTATITHWNIIRYWDLARKINRDDPQWEKIQAQLIGDPDKPNSGYWVPTNNGYSFVNGQMKVPKYIYTYNGKPVHKSPQLVDMKAALGERFNYAELRGFLL